MDKVKSEDEIGIKIDRCLSDALVKIASGAGIGIVGSVLLFKRKPWFLIFSTSVGLGMALANCNNDFKTPLSCVHNQLMKGGN